LGKVWTSAESLAQMEAQLTATDWLLHIRKRGGKENLLRVWNPLNPTISYMVDTKAGTCTCSQFMQQKAKCKHIELAENIDELRRQKRRKYYREYCLKNKDKFKEYGRRYRQKNREKYRERKRKYFQERYHSDPEFREKCLEGSHKRYLKLREALRRFKIELGGKCLICKEDNLGVLEPHHPEGKEERTRNFIHTKEFRRWVRHGIKPNVVLICRNCHLELETAIRHGEPDFTKELI